MIDAFPGPTYALCRHYQFADLHNGIWYLEIVGRGLSKFLLREIRGKEVVRQQSFNSFPEARKVYWARSHKMSLEAGFESAPPPLPQIEWSK
jgi:hypothetical protein